MSIDLAIEDGIALITMNRPERLNALDEDHYEGLSEAWIRVRDDKEIRVAIVTGAGDRAFTAGADLKSPTTRTLADLWQTQKGQPLNRGLEVWKPVIAAINGACLGGGLTLMLATDIRVTVPHATFGVPEVSRGIIPGNGGTQRLLDQLPYPLAMEMLLTGDPIDAETAARWGLVNRIVQPSGLLDTAFSIARRISQNAPLAVQAAKELAIRSQWLSVADGLRLEAAMGQVLRTSNDAQEGKQAFRERRSPDFKGE